MECVALYKPVMPGEVPVRNLGEPEFSTGSETGTMAYTWQAPLHNGFHGFAQLSCGFT
jgi:hypothetical protein